MILLDTNVWIYSAGEKRPEITKAVQDLVRRDEVLGHPFVYGEILLIPGGKAHKSIAERYRDMEEAVVLPIDALVTFFKNHGLAGKGIGFVDACILASAYTMGAKLWTEEKALKEQAVKLGCAYEVEKQ